MAGSVDSPHTTDLDHLLESISHEDNIFSDSWVLDSPPPTSASTEEEKCDSPLGESETPSDAGSSYVSELEKFLMEEEEEEEDGVTVKEGFDADGFLAGLLAQGFRDGESAVHTLDPEAAVDCKRREENEEPPTAEAVGNEDDNPVSKKLRRQMRNSGSGMKSGEKKKLYVKELDKKSKSLEAEYQRLGYSLRCCAGENIALRQCLLQDAAL